MRIWLTSLVLLFVFNLAWSGDSTYTLSGTVNDLYTGEKISDVIILIDNSSQYALTNTEGSYSLQLTSAKYNITFNRLGYYSETIEISLNDNLSRTVELKPRAIVLNEVIVSDGNLADSIIQLAIDFKEKHRFCNTLLKVFTREKVVTDSVIDMLSESFSIVLYNNIDSLKETVYQSRRTSKSLDSFLTTRLGNLINLYRDSVSLFNSIFISPISKGAFSFYKYKLKTQRWIDDKMVYDIEVIPVSNDNNLFKGTLSISDIDYALIEINLSLNKFDIIQHELITSTKINIYEQYFHNKNKIWIPISYKISAEINSQMFLFFRKTMQYERESIVYEHDDAPSDTLNALSYIKQHSPSNMPFPWNANTILPLTKKERDQIQSLDTSKTIIAQKIDDSLEINVMRSLNKYSYIRNLYLGYTRVTGFSLGVRTVDYFNNEIFNGDGFIYYGLADKQWYYKCSLMVFDSPQKSHGLGINIFNQLKSPHHQNLYPAPIMFFCSLVLKDEYLDYYVSNGIGFMYSMKLNNEINFQLSYGYEKQKNKIIMSKYSIFDAHESFRKNIEIQEGSLSSIKIEGKYHQEIRNYGNVSVGSLFEHSNNNWLHSDYSFTNLYLFSVLNITEVVSKYKTENMVSFYVNSGLCFGKVPVQKLFSPETHLSLYAPFGAIKGLNHYEMLGKQLISTSINVNLRVIGESFKNISTSYSIARAWYNPMEYKISSYVFDKTMKIYHEIGFDYSKFNPFIINFTVSLSVPNRLIFTVRTEKIL